MSDTDGQVPLPDLNAADTPAIDDVAYNEDEQASRVAADLEAVFDVPAVSYTHLTLPTILRV